MWQIRQLDLCKGCMLAVAFSLIACAQDENGVKQLDLGARLEGSLKAGAANEYRFTAAESGIYVVETAGFTQIRVLLFGPDDASQALELDGSTGHQTTPDLVNSRLKAYLSAGEYFLRVTHAQAGGVGEYQINVRLAEASNEEQVKAFATDVEDFTISKVATKLALIVGIDQYKNSVLNPTLEGCENDACDMRNLLRREFQFPDKNVEVLLSQNATRANIIRGFRRLISRAAKAKAEDSRITIVVVHYSGHGGQMKDSSPYQDEGDDLDETIIPHDSGVGGVFDITDDEVFILTSELARHTDNVTLVFDSCHSGDAHKGTGRARRVRGERASSPRPLYDDPQAPELPADITIKEDLRDDRNYTFIAGSDSELLSYELDAQEGGGQPRGALTYYLTRAIRRGLKKGLSTMTYRDVMDQVKSDVTAHYQNQHPHLIGSNIDKVVFGDTTVKIDPYVTARLDELAIVLNAGAVHGMTQGSQFDLYPLDKQDLSDPHEALARIVLNSVDSFGSEAAVPEKLSSAARPATYRAAERLHVTTNQPVSILIEAPPTDALEKIRDMLETNEEFEGYFRVKDSGDARLVIGEQDGQIEVTRAGEADPFVRIATDESDLLKQVGQIVRDWTRWTKVRQLANPSSDLEIEFSFMLEGVERPEETSNGLDITVFDGTQLQARIKNNSDRRLFFYFLNLTGEGAVTDLQNGRQHPLNDGRSVGGAAFTFAIPRVDDRPKFQRFREMIKIIASENSIDVAPLLVAGTKSRSADSLEQLLANAGLNSKASMSVAPGTWVTVSREIETVVRD